jgi:phage gp46-like protein
MPRIKDFKLVETPNKYYDLQINNGQVSQVETLETAILMSIFMEKRASETQVPIPEYRSGWWGNTLNSDNYEIGSLFWLSKQRRLTNVTSEFIRDTLKKSLQWLIDDKFVSTLVVRVRELNPEKSTLTVEIIYSIGGRVDSIVIDAWKRFYRENV